MTDQSQKGLRQRVATLLDSQKLAVLCTRCAEQPYGSLITFAFTPDLQRLYFATARQTRKFNNLQDEERVALVIDSRNNEPSDFRDASAATVMGSAHECAGDEAELGRQALLERHPELKEFFGAPSCAILAVSVEKYIVVNRFQSVFELIMAPPACR